MMILPPAAGGADTGESMRFVRTVLIRGKQHEAECMQETSPGRRLIRRTFKTHGRKVQFKHTFWRRPRPKNTDTFWLRDVDLLWLIVADCCISYFMNSQLSASCLADDTIIWTVMIKWWLSSFKFNFGAFSSEMASAGYINIHAERSFQFEGGVRTPASSLRYR